MRINDLSKQARKIFLLVWAILCIFLFMSFPGKATYVQWANLAEWRLLAEKLDRFDLVQDFLNLLQSIVGVVIFSLACTSLGIFVARKIRIDHSPVSQPAFTRVAFLATEFLIGHGLFSLVFLTLGGLYRLTPIYVSLLLAAGFLLGASSLKITFLDAFADVKFAWKEGLLEKTEKVIGWLCRSILFLTLLYSTARISYDSSAVYFSDAKLTAMTQRVQFFTEDSFVASLFHSAIQFSALIQLFGDQSARMLSWVFGIIVIIFGLALGERMGISKRARLILFAVLLTSTAFLDLMGDGKVDLMSSAPAIAAVYWVVVEAQSQSHSKSLLILSGFLVGLAIIARPFNAILLGIFVLLFYFQRIYIKNGFRAINYKQFICSMLWIGMGILSFGIYHLFANWMILGDPLHFVSNVSRVNPSSGPWDFNPNQILAVRLLYPFVATYYNSPQTLGNISPMFLAFLPAFLMRDIRRNISFSKQLYILCVISLVTLYLWIFLFFTVYEIRYVLFLWIILFIPLAEIIASVLNDNELLYRSLLSALIITLLIFSIVRTVYISLDTYSPMDKQGNPQCFCESLPPINNVAAPGDRVLTLSAFRYYLRTDLFACSTKHDEYNQLRDAAKLGTEPFWLEVYQQGYKYISFEIEYTTKHLQMGIAPSPENAPDWLELQPLYIGPGGTHIAYRIDIKNPPSEATVECKLSASGIWEVEPIK